MKAESAWIWGHHSIEAALQACPELVLEVQYEPKAEKDFRAKIAPHVQGQAIKKVPHLPRSLNDKRHQGMVALLKKFPLQDFRDAAPQIAQALAMAKGGQLVFLDGVQDPRNYGAILRSAGAFGAMAVFTGTRDQCPLTGVVAQASAGNLFRTRNVQVRQPRELWDWVEEQGYLICALDGSGQDMEKFFKQQAQRSPEQPILWLVGAEGEGLNSRLLERAGQVLRIPMQAGVESLNVAVAASIAFYRAAQLKEAKV